MQGHEDSDEQQLVEQVRTGSRGAFDRLARRHTPRLLGLATRMLASPAEAEDAVQNALASVWLGRHRLATDRAIGGYLTTVTLNKCRDRLRRRKAAGFLGFGGGLDEAVSSDLAPDPEVSAADREALARVQGEVERLPIRLREALVLVTMDGRSQKEAADLLGVTEKTIETRIYRARNRLREKLDFL